MNDSLDIDMKTEARRTVVMSLVASIIFSAALICGVIVYLR
jgi:hypothetical protein